MNALQILREGRKLIADREKWTQGQYARMSPDSESTLKGTGCNSASPKAVCWCSGGALRYLAMEARMDEDGFMLDMWYKTPNHEKAEQEANTILNRVASRASAGEYNSIEGYNDSHTHEEVLAAWDAAISIAGG